MIILYIIIILVHYFLTVPYENLFFQLLFHESVTNQPNVHCLKSPRLECISMPPRNLLMITMILIIISFYIKSDFWTIALSVLVIILSVALYGIMMLNYTPFQAVIGIFLGTLYSLVYILTPMKFYFWIFPLVYVIVVVSLLESKIRTTKIPSWVSPDLYYIITNKINNITLIDKIRLVSLIALQRSFILFLPWNKLETYLDNIVHEYKDYKIDYVVGIKSGGAIISNYIAAKLELPVTYMKISRKCNKNVSDSMQEYIKKYVLKRKDTFVVCEDLMVNVQGKNILLIDENVGTGGTLRASRDYIMQKGASNVYLACVEDWGRSKFTNKELFVAAKNDSFVVWPWGYDN